MQSKNHNLAQLAALLARHQPNASAYTCAKLALDLTSIGKAISKAQTWACNGYKNEAMDRRLCRLSMLDVPAANAYAAKINEDGEAYVAKRMAALEKKLSAIRAETGLDFQAAGLSGICWKLPNGSEYFI